MVGLTFTLWFALVKTYSASKLSAFTFVTPLFGVAASYFIMHDKLTLVFGVAALLVIAGLYHVNKPDPKIVPDPNFPPEVWFMALSSEVDTAAAGSAGSRSKTGSIRRSAGCRISSETAPARAHATL